MVTYKDIFQQQIWEWFCNDMDSCILVSTDLQKKGVKSKFSGGINFPAALACFSVIELMSGYHAGRKPDNNNISKFISKYIGKYYSKLKNEKIAKTWYEVFRNGLSHQWLPKNGGVSMDMNSQEIFVFQIPIGWKYEIPYLVVPKFYYALKEALKDFENDLDKNEELRKRFKKRYKEIIVGDKEKMGIFKDMYDKN